MEARDAPVAEAPDVTHLDVHASPRRLVRAGVAAFDDDGAVRFDRLLDADGPTVPFGAGDGEELSCDRLLAAPRALRAAIGVMLGEAELDVVGEDLENGGGVTGREI